MKLAVYNKEGKKVSDFEMPENIFSYPWKPALVKQVVLAYLANARRPVAHTKTRGEVRGGGKKPWKQKGLGRARHGSIRSPIWVGGGVAHGPRNEKDYSQKINKKMRLNALKSALARKLKDNEIILVDEFTQELPRTKEAKDMLVALKDAISEKVFKKRNATIIILPEMDKVVAKSFDNLSNTDVKDVMNLNVYDLLKYKFVLFVDPQNAMAKLEERVK